MEPWPEGLVTVLEHIFASRYFTCTFFSSSLQEQHPLLFSPLVLRVSCTAAGYVILLYDHLLTLGDEVEYVWKARGTIPKYLFLINRYTVPLIMLGDVHCKFVSWMHLQKSTVHMYRSRPSPYSTFGPYIRGFTK